MSSQLIVIIDDSATHLTILERLTRSLGRISAKTFVDADLALAFCRELRPDLVVLSAAGEWGEAADLIGRLHHQEGCTEVQGYIFSTPKPAAELKRSYFADHAPQSGDPNGPQSVPDLAIFPTPQDHPAESAPALRAAMAGS